MMRGAEQRRSSIADTAVSLLELPKSSMHNYLKTVNILGHVQNRREVYLGWKF